MYLLRSIWVGWQTVICLIFLLFKKRLQKEKGLLDLEKGPKILYETYLYRSTSILT